MVFTVRKQAGDEFCKHYVLEKIWLPQNFFGPIVVYIVYLCTAFFHYAENLWPQKMTFVVHFRARWSRSLHNN